MHLKLRNLDAALKDAECAVELDPQYAKAYLRRASAHQALEHFEEAVKDFEKVTFAAVSMCQHAAMQCSVVCMLVSEASGMVVTMSAHSACVALNADEATRD